MDFLDMKIRHCQIFSFHNKLWCFFFVFVFLFQIILFEFLGLAQSMECLARRKLADYLVVPL